MDRDYAGEARVFKAFCDETRLRILDLLRGGEKCVCALIEETGLPQSTLSYHMKILCDAGVAAGRQEGKWTHYSVRPAGMARAADILKGYAPANKPKRKSPDCCASA